MESFDDVVVGAGSAGCVLAGRLSENRARRVLLLEAGPKDRHPAIHVPAAFPRLFRSRLDWDFATTPQGALGGRQLYWPRGRVLGGSSAINAMMWLRGFAADYDAWAEVAGSAWSYEAMVPVFRRIEATEEAAGRDDVGLDGPLAVSRQRSPNPLTTAWLDAAGELGIARPAALNTGRDEGVALAPVNQRRGRRVSLADAYLAPARGRANLVVRTDAQVLGLTFSGRRADGLSYRRGRQTEHVGAGRIFLCAGAVATPQLLLCSGVGPAAELTRLGVEVVVDAPEVGRNLADHLVSGIAVATPSHASLRAATRPAALLDYLVRRRGLLTSNVAEGCGFVRSRADLELPDLELLFVPGPFVDEGLTLPTRHGMTLGAVLLQPASRGTVRLRETDVRSAPLIDPGYLSDPEGRDARTLAEGIRICLRLLATDALSPLVGEALQPSGPLDDDLVEVALRRYAQTLYHPVGTCRMGRDPASVVDERLAVRNVANLVVADASVMPQLIRGHTNAPTVAIAERAAEFHRLA